jgi:hypothetical protein
MATILAVDPFAYGHPQSLCRPNIQYADHLHARLDIRHNAVRVASGNPVLIVFHGGSFSANHKTVFGYLNSNGSLGRFYDSYFLNSGVYGTDEYFDVVHVEYPCHSHEGVPESVYELVIPGKGVSMESISIHGVRVIEYAQRAVQWVIDNAVPRGWNPHRIVLFGHSIGGWLVQCAAFTPSPSWNPRATDPFTPKSEFKVCGVGQWAAEVSLSTRVLHTLISRFGFNAIDKVDSDGLVRVKDRMNRLLLKKDSSGAYSDDSERTELCKAMSPVDLIARRLPSNSHLKVWAMYRKRFMAGDPPVPIVEETLVPGPGETTIPPYYASGHDWREGLLLGDACSPQTRSDPGVPLDLYILDGEEGATFNSYGNPQKEAYEYSCPIFYAWAKSVAA